LDFETVGDPHHEIPSRCEDKGWLELFVNKQTDFLRDENSKLSHPKGYFQPGVLCLDANQRVLYRWRSVPNKKNIGGAAERPTAGYIYKQVLKSLSSTGEAEDAPLDTQPELDSEGKPWPIFILVVMANGWFIKPKPFLLTNGSAPIAQRFRNVLIRIPIFIAAWILAWVMLPGMWVGLAAVVYSLWITPHIRHIHLQIQDVEVTDSQES
tara:strand:- start:1921 stop:2550 length:630 start_codon:yes stop_codon:yes gene_type:complete